ncbi:MAG: gamma-glutamyltransferase [Bacteroidetes bacterium]|nr:gamma-glutamyltransferase [Bacteroidota bacterium]
MIMQSRSPLASRYLCGTTFSESCSRITSASHCEVCCVSAFTHRSILSEDQNPYNVVEPGKRPGATLTPGLALKEGKPFLSFAVQGGDSQDQNLLQFFLNVVEFGMNVQEAAEAPNINTFQLHGSFGSHWNSPGRIRLNDSIPSWTRTELKKMGYRPEYSARTSGPITAIYFDWEHHSFWGGASNHGEDYGIAW